MSKIKNKHVLVVASGSNTKKYWNKIEEFIKDNNVITVGCNAVDHLLTPRYTFWGSTRRLEKYGKKMSAKTNPIFPPNWTKKQIKKYWKDPYEVYNPSERLPGSTTKTHKNIYHYFKSIAMVAILWAYSNKASKISIVGMDGYTFYSQEQLSSKDFCQHCYGEGMTDGQDYILCRKKDIRNNQVLKKLYKYGKKKYGFYFKCLTPTVFTYMYDSSVLDLNEKYEGKILENKKDFKVSKRKKFVTEITNKY